MQPATDARWTLPFDKEVCYGSSELRPRGRNLKGPVQPRPLFSRFRHLHCGQQLLARFHADTHAFGARGTLFRAVPADKKNSTVNGSNLASATFCAELRHHSGLPTQYSIMSLRSCESVCVCTAVTVWPSSFLVSVRINFIHAIVLDMSGCLFPSSC